MFITLIYAICIDMCFPSIAHTLYAKVVCRAAFTHFSVYIFCIIRVQHYGHYVHSV